MSPSDTSGYELLDVRLQPDHAPKWAGLTIAVFSHPPMKYLFVYDGVEPYAWPSSLNEAMATALAQEFQSELERVVILQEKGTHHD